MIRAKAWNGKDLKGTWEVTLKIDGVRALLVDGKWVSRANKPLYNIPPWRPGMPTDCEVYLGPEYGDQKGRYRATIRAVRTQTLKPHDGCKLKNCKCQTPDTDEPEMRTCPNFEEATPVIHPDHLYSLDPLDIRLRGFFPGCSASGIIDNPTEAQIRFGLRDAVALGWEGLVLRKITPRAGMVPYEEGVWLKVKPAETYDVRVTGAVEGTGKHKGRLGALQTAKGDVGTGFTDAEREEIWRKWEDPLRYLNDPLEGSIVEVEFMGWTPDGKFRHPRFVRFRPDKDAEG